MHIAFQSTGVRLDNRADVNLIESANIRHFVMLAIVGHQLLEPLCSAPLLRESNT